MTTNRAKFNQVKQRKDVVAGDNNSVLSPIDQHHHHPSQTLAHTHTYTHILTHTHTHTYMHS